MTDVLRGSHANGAIPAQKHPAARLHLPREAIDAQEALYQVPGKNCDGQADVFTGDTPISPEDAEILCAGCPALELCREYDRLAKPTHGLWGGVWRGDTDG